MKDFTLIPRCALCALLASSLLVACSPEPASTVEGPRVVPANPMKDAAIAANKELTASQAKLAGLSAEELRSKIAEAQKANHLYSPAGENALEYSLALRALAGDKPDGNAESGIIDLLPYAVIATEQAIEAGNFDEAARLRLLIERGDPLAPSLPRLKAAIANMGLAATEKKLRLEAERVAAEAAAQKEKEDLAKAEKLAAAAKAAEVPVAQPVLPPAPVAPPPIAAPVAEAKPAPPPAPVAHEAPKSSSLVAISTPQPAYPAEAQRGHVSGTVEVSILINRDGSVGNVSITSARPRGVFERSVLASVKKWKFQPMDASQTISRTFSFTP